MSHSDYVQGFSEDTWIAWLFDEGDMLRVFLAATGTLSSKHADIMLGHLRHCLLQDSVALQMLRNMIEGCNALNEGVDSLLNIDFTVRKIPA
jgi:hypothetical protein